MRKRKSSRKGNILYFLILFCFVFLGSNSVVHSQSGWSVGASFQAAQGNYIFDTNTNNYYLYSNLRYQSGRWNFSASLPLVAQNNDQITRTGGMLLPTGQMHGDEINTTSFHGGGMMGRYDHDMMAGSPVHLNALIWGLGDVYLWNSYQLLFENGDRPALILNGQIKVPTASVEKNYGTGEFDFGFSFTFRKTVSQFLALFDLGYLILGDPEGINYIDPITFGGGLGKTFDRGKYSILLYYQGYSKIFEEFEAPAQASLGLNYRLNQSIALSVVGTKGLSNTSPDFSFSSGIDWIF